MLKTNCPDKKRRVFLVLIVFLLVICLPGFLLSDVIYAQTVSETIRLQGKIVRNDSGYEGLNVVNGTPSCVQAGTDSCAFRVRYYSASSGGTLYYTETFSNVEIGDYGGVFNLQLGAGSGTSGTEANIKDVLGKYRDIYIEISFDPAGGTTYGEVFTRTTLNASAFAISSAQSHADSFKFFNASSSSGLTCDEGSVYYDTTDDELKLCVNSVWTSLATGGSSLWSESDISSLTSHETNYLVNTGIGTFDAFTLDNVRERLSINTSNQKGGLSIYSSYTSTSAWPLMSLKTLSGFSGPLVQLHQGGTGNVLEAYIDGSSTSYFSIDRYGDLHLGNNGVAYFEEFTSLPTSGDLNPATAEGCIYTVDLTTTKYMYWDPACDANAEIILTDANIEDVMGTYGGSSSSLWTDGGTFTYLDSTTDDLVLGSNATATSAFFFDVSEGRLGIGTDTPQAAIDIAGASSVISNSSGQITIIPDTNLVIKANDTANDVFLIAQDSSGTERFRIHANSTDNFYAGYQAGYSNVTGVRNTFVGGGAGRSNTGDYNTALGMEALYSNSSGTRNVAIGTQALRAVTTGTDNLGLGYRALYNNTASSNAAFGSFSSFYNTSGANNTGFGAFTLYHNTTGSGNVAIGFHAGRGSGASAYAQNTLIGYQSGYSLGSGSDGNVMLGYSAGYSETGSNKLYIANSTTTTPLIYGEFDNSLLKITGSLQPGANNTYSFGASSNRWADVYAQGTVQIGADGDSGSIRYNTTDNQLEFSNDGTNWIPLADVTKTETLSAEYPGAVLVAEWSGANNGSMTADQEGVGSNWMNYYEWNSSEATSQGYEVRVRYTLPHDFDSWGTNAFTFHYATESTSTSNNLANFYVFEETQSSPDASDTNNVSASPGVWTTSTVAGSSLTCNAAGETCMIILRMYSANDNYTRIGDIDINYNRKL